MDKMNLICVDDQREVLNAISRDLAPPVMTPIDAQPVAEHH